MCQGEHFGVHTDHTKFIILFGVSGVEFFTERFVSCLGEETLFIQDRHDTHLLFNQINGGLQIQTEVNKLPFHTLSQILLLFQNKHVVIEKLLEFFVGQVDTELFKAVLLKDLETGNIQATNKGLCSNGHLQSRVDFGNNPLEQTLVDGF
eukprot:Lithocolla_globosa_v1_NODE_497_length_3887_cov_213.445459.p3 type:complete len:150 gc:universal NODE_497_length_3887_cov_213.445459:2167-2616(+)